ncbi:MAG TPA: hypothetical protein DEE98_00310 [Elusimicrobia bacterium]|nr:MAG: hypothetical protein A2278_08615 [Elusimicrobia bacterium RIFOXYA12_FULL_49_49]OGS09632.1 MAG: hypothetical protein A2204_04040 [Elusimicrobia bacterium RIFOXYA1_FULL_47_7]OGS10752.1 MAG: hypothetical protein A2386_01790 [Elusimicrobia bacterium RIFOXYB1_FULL_48_9]OGS14809.1 MAG: hypothetical protein A2251_09980 [Elusimicrobia bacterium RIFOXYA2_FULL_47_53]OGS25541.1 MAG: hypothetical protein A2339_05615 [Elusimicrobia bacterium RIFOXYB12_FULL_50_12]OGS28907.1 MAG: hypothetical protein
MPALSLRDSKEFSGTSCKQKLAGLLQRTLRSRITSLLNNHSINFDPVWIGEFVKKRNHAAHGNYSYESKDYMILARMISLLDIVIMKELGYKGEYIDWSKSPPEEIILS